MTWTTPEAPTWTRADVEWRLRTCREVNVGFPAGPVAPVTFRYFDDRSEQGFCTVEAADWLWAEIDKANEIDRQNQEDPG